MYNVGVGTDEYSTQLTQTIDLSPKEKFLLAGVSRMICLSRHEQDEEAFRSHSAEGFA